MRVFDKTPRGSKTFCSDGPTSSCYSSDEDEIERMEQVGVIVRVSEPTEWCAGMVVVPKVNNKVRICVDLTWLNESVCRERHPLPTVEQTLAQLAGAKVFTKLDANLGFWQIPLSPESVLLISFITPFGRYCFCRLPFGITSAPEHFQRRMSDLLSGLDGVVCMIDDILVHGRTAEEHDDRLTNVLQRLEVTCPRGVETHLITCQRGETGQLTCPSWNPPHHLSEGGNGAIDLS